MITFIFYLPEKRQGVFTQQIRLLSQREKIDNCQAVIIWQDQQGTVDLSGFGHVVQKTINLPRYNKGVLVNAGVHLADGEKLVILDSDRVLPAGYFSKELNKLSSGSAVAPIRMIKAMTPVTDDKLKEMKFQYRRDDRTTQPTMHRKHIFSGNTILFKSDYLLAGGMDESYWGYGFNDLDFGKSWLSNGFNVSWSDAEEIHLFHERLDQYDPDTFYAQNAINARRYCVKWDEPLPPTYDAILASKGIFLL